MQDHDRFVEPPAAEAGISERVAKQAPRSVLQRPVGPGMILAIILGVVLVRGWLIEGLIVSGRSMEPTLHDRERLLVLKKHYSAKNLPSRGDIVIFSAPGDGEPVVKRVVGLPGEVLQTWGSRVFINGELLSEPYAYGRQPTPRALQIPPGYVYLLGDNRDNSEDSRYFGPIDLQNIRGRAVLVLWPPPPQLVTSVE
jgi:signal peptidase I